MKIRYKKTGSEGHASTFNTHALAEVLVNFDEGDADSAFISELDVLLPSGWKDMKQAFADHDLVTDNFNTCFFPPRDQMERERGWRIDHVPSEPVGLSMDRWCSKEAMVAWDHYRLDPLTHPQPESQNKE